MNQVISILAIGGLIFVTAVGTLRSWPWPLRVLRGVASVLVSVARVVIIPVVVGVLVAVPVAIVARYTTLDGAVGLAVWFLGFPVLLPIHVISVAIASHMKNPIFRVLVVIVGTGGLVMPSEFLYLHEAVWVWVHAALVGLTWDALFRQRDRPLLGIPGRALTIPDIRPVSPAEDEPLQPLEEGEQ